MSKQVKIGIAVVLLVVALVLIFRSCTGAAAVRPGESVPGPEAVQITDPEVPAGGRFQAK